MDAVVDLACTEGGVASRATPSGAAAVYGPQAKRPEPSRLDAYVRENGGRRIDPNSSPLSGSGQGKSAISLAELTRSTTRVTESIQNVAW